MSPIRVHLLYYQFSEWIALKGVCFCDFCELVCENIHTLVSISVHN